MKTAELIGLALDWAVAKCEGETWVHYFSDEWFGQMHYSTDWAQGGPIIEREKINVTMSATAPWMAFIYDGLDMTWIVDGPTPLIAAMRCYCCAKLGDEIEIPQELQPCQQPNL